MGSREVVESTSKFIEQGNKYDKDIFTKCGKKGVVDVYRVLDAFKSGCPILDHISKKSLCAGTRGHKNRLEDLIDIQKSIKEAISLERQKEGAMNGFTGV